MLMFRSAPVFATIGFAVRIRNSGNKDVSWKQPEILLWGAGELASGNLIICFPELAVIFRASAWRMHSTPRKPGASTLRGWSEPHSARKKVSDPYMTKSLMSGTLNGPDGQYIELDDAGNNVHITHAESVCRPPETGDRVMVKNEVRVETHSLT